MKRAAVVFADGFEDIEAISIVDVLRRADVELSIAGLDAMEVLSSRGVPMRADLLLSELEDDIDALVLPGGLPGAENLADSSLLHERITRMLSGKKLVAAICAAPALVLGRYLAGRRCTCYPGFEEHIHADAKLTDERVVTDAGIITSRGPATAIDFALAVAEHLVGKDVATQVSRDLLHVTA